MVVRPRTALGGIPTTGTRAWKEKTPSLGEFSRRGNTPVGYGVSAAVGSARLERGHHVAREPAKLLLELLRGESLGPMDHEVLEPRILRRDRLHPVDHVRRRAAEPRFLLDSVGERRRARGGARRAPRAPLLVGVAHEAERREPLVALVVRRLDLALGLFGRVGQIEPGAPDHVLAELFLVSILHARVAI